MIIALCVLQNRERKKISITFLIITVVICCVLYFLCWAVYYIGIVNMLVTLGLSVLPCIAFILFAVDRKNIITIIPIINFTVCHLIYGIVNFII